MDKIDPCLFISDNIISWFVLMSHCYSLQRENISTKLLKNYQILSQNFKLKTLLLYLLAFIYIRVVRTYQSSLLILVLRSKSLRPQIQSTCFTSSLQKLPNFLSRIRNSIPQTVPTNITMLLGCFNIYKSIHSLISPMM